MTKIFNSIIGKFFIFIIILIVSQFIISCGTPGKHKSRFTRKTQTFNKKHKLNKFKINLKDENVAC